MRFGSRHPLERRWIVVTTLNLVPGPMQRKWRGLNILLSQCYLCASCVVVRSCPVWLYARVAPDSTRGGLGCHPSLCLAHARVRTTESLLVPWTRPCPCLLLMLPFPPRLEIIDNQYFQVLLGMKNGVPTAPDSEMWVQRLSGALYYIKLTGSFYRYGLWDASPERVTAILQSRYRGRSLVVTISHYIWVSRVWEWVTANSLCRVLVCEKLLTYQTLCSIHIVCPTRLRKRWNPFPRSWPRSQAKVPILQRCTGVRRLWCEPHWFQTQKVYHFRYRTHYSVTLIPIT